MMRVGISTNHAGYSLKKPLTKSLRELKHKWKRV
jgi:hypothetical protein